MFRARIEFSLAVVFGVLTALTLIWPTWIESLFGIAPDHGSGQTEWLFVVLFGLLGLVLNVLGGRDYRAAGGLREAGESAGS
jgi:hypothetical protein